MAFDLTGQTAIVTGAATGIGEAIARRFAASGATVAVADLNLAGAEEVAKTLAHGSFGLQLDIASAESVNRAVADVLARTGRIDILVNNAGIAGKAAPLWQQKDEDWQLCISVNMTGVFNCCAALIGHLRYGK